MSQLCNNCTSIYETSCGYMIREPKSLANKLSSTSRFFQLKKYSKRSHINSISKDKIENIL